MGSKFVELFPEEFAAIDDAAAAEVEKIGGDERGFGVVGEDVGVVALGGGDALALFDVFERAEEVAIGGGLFEEFLFGGGGHALFEAFDQVAALAVEKKADVADGFGVLLVGGEACDARAVAALNVVLEAGARVIAREIDVAAGDHEALVDEGEDAAREIRGKIRAEVERRRLF